MSMYPRREAKNNAELMALDANGRPLYEPPGFYEMTQQRVDPDEMIGPYGSVTLELTPDGDHGGEPYIALLHVEEPYRESDGHEAYITADMARAIIAKLTAALPD